MCWILVLDFKPAEPCVWNTVTEEWWRWYDAKDDFEFIQIFTRKFYIFFVM